MRSQHAIDKRNLPDGPLNSPEGTLRKAAREAGPNVLLRKFKGGHQGPFAQSKVNKASITLPVVWRKR